MKRAFIIVFALLAAGLIFSAEPAQAQTFNVGDLIKLPDDGNNDTQPDSTVYYYGSDGKRHVFPNERTYFTWYEDFRNVRIIDAETLASIPIGRTIYSKPGVMMVKLEADPRVYGVAKGGVLRQIPTEEIAEAIYGDPVKGIKWQEFVLDVPASFWTNYTPGGILVDKPAALNPEGEAFVAKSISLDMGLPGATIDTL